MAVIVITKKLGHDEALGTAKDIEAWFRANPRRKVRRGFLVADILEHTIPITSASPAKEGT
jgi:hypothetical protein